MLVDYQSQSEYHQFVEDEKKTMDSSELARLDVWYCDIQIQLEMVDTDAFMKAILDLYGQTGRPAKNQPQIMRSFVLFALMVGRGETSCSLTNWVKRLNYDRVLATLIGCPLDSLPPLGSYYDLMDRVWQGPVERYGRDFLLPADWNNRKAEKPEKKHEKAPDGSKSKASEKVTEKLVNRLLAGKAVPLNFEEKLEYLFYLLAVLPSLECGVIPDGELVISGDGTAVHTHANSRGHHTADQTSLSPEEYAAAPRHYSDPDARWGWDSDLDKHYFGYNLFSLVCHNPTLRTDIPLLMRFTSAKRHDSIAFLTAFGDLRKHMPALSPRFVCLDSAMDNEATYNLLAKSDIAAMIDINPRRGKNSADKITFNKDGTPLCAAGLEMHPNGNDKSQKYRMWRCPYGKDHTEKCSCSCSSAKYGKTLKVKMGENRRYNTKVPRGTDEWKNIYKQRTASERINNRILNDYRLHQMRVHGRHRYSFFAMIIGICIHLNARLKQAKLAD